MYEILSYLTHVYLTHVFDLVYPFIFDTCCIYAVIFLFWGCNLQTSTFHRHKRLVSSKNHERSQFSTIHNPHAIYCFLHSLINVCSFFNGWLVAKLCCHNSYRLFELHKYKGWVLRKLWHFYCSPWTLPNHRRLLSSAAKMTARCGLFKKKNPSLPRAEGKFRSVFNCAVLGLAACLFMESLWNDISLHKLTLSKSSWGTVRCSG